MTGNDVNDVEHAPYVMEGSRDNALEIYFEGEASKRAYLDVDARPLGAEMGDVYNRTTGVTREM